MNCNQVKKISIIEYLGALGFQYVRKTGNKYLFHSPYRADKTASMWVDMDINAWFDHGTGDGGNIIDLATRINGTRHIKEVLDYFNNTQSFFSFQQQVNPQLKEKSVFITAKHQVHSKALYYYMCSERGINPKLLKKYCFEIHYQVAGKNFYSVGFQNNGGGFELRNRYCKSATSPKDITTIDVGSSYVSIFEGFIDFLSWLDFNNLTDPTTNVIVLNTVNLLPRLRDLDNYQRIYLFLDNDVAGKESAEKIMSAFPACYDNSYQYKDYKDFNEFLLAQKSKK